MAFGLYSLLEAGLLVLNAICVLHEERFLAKVGWSSSQPPGQGFTEARGVKHQILDIIRSVRTVMRIPLIFINLLVITKKLILG
jgi:hypothetical protein